MSIHIAQSLALFSPRFLVGPVQQTLMLLYLGPDSLMPLASILAAVIGIVLIFWRRLLKPFKKTGVSNEQPPESVVDDSPTVDVHDDEQS